MKKILLDTNFLLIPGNLKVDIFTEIGRIADFKYKLCVLDKTKQELKNIIEKQSQKHSRAAQLALSLIPRKGIQVLKTVTNKNVDKLILKTANSKSFIVATQDRELKRQLREKNVPVIVLRQKKYLKLL